MADVAMTIIEGMKELRLIEKKMKVNSQRILEYSSIISTEKPYFATEEEQGKQVKGLIQSNLDLADRYMKIKRAIERTNLETRITFGEKKFTLSDLLTLKRKLIASIQETYHALSDTAAQAKKNSFQRVSGDKEVSIKRLYDENEKHQSLRYWMELLSEMDGRLEVVNATTSLIFD